MITAENLYEETLIGGLKAKNHFVRSATAIGNATEDGLPGEAVMKEYTALAKGQIGTIVSGIASVADYEQSSRRQFSIPSDNTVPAYKALVDAVHAEGSNILMQLFHGSSSSQVHPETSKILGPSAIPNPFSGLTPKEMDKEDLSLAVRLFAEAASRAKRAGFDGVQLHAGHSGLLSQFLSPGFNRRTDEYGGSRANRYRFIREIYQAIRDAAGADYPIWIKIDSTDVFEDGLTTEDFLCNGMRMAEDGFDAIEVSGMVHPRMYRGAYYREAGEQLSEQISKSVILTGGLRNLEDMVENANESRLRFFGMSTPFIRYPDYLLNIRK